MPEAAREPLGRRLRRRLRRLSLKRVQPAALPWVLLCWAFSVALVVALLWPGALASVAGRGVRVGEDFASFDPPFWFRVLALLTAAVFAGTATVVSRTAHRDGPRAIRRLADEVIAGVAIVLPIPVLLADRAWLFAVAAALLAVAAELLRRAPRGVAGVLAAGPWLVLLGYQFTLAGRAPASWVWVALFGFGAVVAAFGAYYGVARAAESRTKAIRVLFREHWNRWVVLLVAAIAGAAVALRLTLLRHLFPEPDPQLWFPWDRLWASWLFAALVAATLVAVAIRSARHPLRRIGQRRVTAALALLGNLHLVFTAVLIVIALGMAAVGDVDVPAEWGPVVPWLKVAGVALVGLGMFLPQLRGTSARWIGIVAALFLIPNTLATAMGLPAGFAPSPVQVAMLIVLAALVLAVWNLFRRAPRPSVIARLAAVPVIAVHAGWLLPAIWTEFGLALGVAITVVSQLLLQPPAARDNATHSVRMMTSAASQLLAFGIALVAAPSLLDDPGLIVLGLIWLSVVVVAALSFETVEPDVYTEDADSPEDVATGPARA